MTEAAKKARRAYYRKWYREHREQVRAQQEAYWEAKAKEATEDEQKIVNEGC